MKINQSYWKENDDDRKSVRAIRAAEARRQNVENETHAAAKSRQIESPVKDDMKFAGMLQTAENPLKLKQTEDDSSEQRRDDDKKDKKRADGQKDSFDSLSNSDRIEKYNQSNGGQSGGGFGTGGNVNQTISLSENFAARSILHIADLERMISAVRTQISLGGKREVYLELKRSVLEGLKVKITTEAAQTQIEFLAANEQVRSQIESHSEELAEILRGRGINLKSLKTILITENAANDSQSKETETSQIGGELSILNSSENSPDDDTFGSENEASIYRA